ncbi:MAG: hypothetical protein VX309_01080 [Pseudomonadota bacterium]|nr:hypothetical protein [Pseudomonadota bacterium]MEE3154106.1 hypothetical protein [Pseudomonadota bacterium]
MTADRELRIAALSACLALVRPVGMTEDETIDWLEVAADTISDIPSDIAERGARIARTKCTHHAQIVPTIISETKDAVEWRRRPTPALRLVAPKAVEDEPREPEPLPDPETLMPVLREMGLQRGWIIELEDGRLAWADGDGAEHAA